MRERTFTGKPWRHGTWLMDTHRGPPDRGMAGPGWSKWVVQVGRAVGRAPACRGREGGLPACLHFVCGHVPRAGHTWLRAAAQFHVRAGRGACWGGTPRCVFPKDSSLGPAANTATRICTTDVLHTPTPCLQTRGAKKAPAGNLPSRRPLRGRSGLRPPLHPAPSYWPSPRWGVHGRNLEFGSVSVLVKTFENARKTQSTVAPFCSF